MSRVCAAGLQTKTIEVGHNQSEMVIPNQIPHWIQAIRSLAPLFKGGFAVLMRPAYEWPWRIPEQQKINGSGDGKRKPSGYRVGGRVLTTFRCALSEG